MLRVRVWTRAGLVGLLTAGVLALVPVAPAAAIQAVGWTTTPPSTATLGDKVSFAWSGTANTFLGARITGCFANFPDGSNYTNAFGGNFTTGNCSYTDRTMTVPGTYQISAGFTLSTGSTMSLQWNVSVAAPTPSVQTSGDVVTTATSVSGAPATFTASASDPYYGSYGANCSPASGSEFPVGQTTVTCSATNSGGKTGTATLKVTVGKASPAITWDPPSPVTYGVTYGDLMTATMAVSDATGSLGYTTAGGDPVTSGDVVPVGADQVLSATYTPTGPAATAYNAVTVERTVTVERAVSAVAFGSGTPADKQYGDAPFPVSADGTSGAGDVTIGAEPGSACTVGDATTGTSVSATVTLTGAGSCVLLADQAGTGTHTAAQTAQWSVTVAKANPVVTWAPPTSLTYGAPVSELFTADVDAAGTISYLVDGASLAPDTVLDAGVGRVVSLLFTPDVPGDYAGATAERTFDVEPAAQTLTMAAVADRTFGDGPVTLDIGGTGPGLVSASASGACSVEGLEVTLVSAGICSVEASKAATSNYLAAGPVTRTFAVAKATPQLTWAPPSSITYGTALGVDQLNAVAAQPGSVTYTVDDADAPAHGQVLAAGDHVLRARFVPTDGANFTVATAQVPLTVVAPVVFSTATPVSTTLTIAANKQTQALVRCSSGTTRCVGTVQLLTARRQLVAGRWLKARTVLARAAFSIDAGKVQQVRLRPSQVGRRVLGNRALRRALLSIGEVDRTVRLRR